MKYKYGFYCSGNATRVLKFYESKNINIYQVGFVFYDGDNLDVERKLQILFRDKLILFKNDKKLKGKYLSQCVSDLLLYNMKIKEIDYLFCFGSMILKENLINQYKNKIINFHPSILPSFPGLNAIDQALASSVKYLGNTAHFIDNGIDTGPIIMQSVLCRKSYKDYEDVLNLQLLMLIKIWHFLETDKIIVKNNFVEINTEETQESSIFSF